MLWQRAQNHVNMVLPNTVHAGSHAAGAVFGSASAGARKRSRAAGEGAALCLLNWFRPFDRLTRCAHIGGRPQRPSKPELDRLRG